MKYAPSFEDLHAAHLREGMPGAAPRARICHPQTLIVAAYLHLEEAPRYHALGDGFRLQYTLEELSDRIGMLPSTVKTALRRCQDNGLLLVEPSTVKGHLAISTLWPPTPNGGAS